MSRKRTYIMLTAVLVVLALSGCRRDLWVYTDDIRQVELYTDWSRCDSRPDGMTAWFISNDNDGRNRRITTAEVEHAWLNLPRGRFTGIIFDWSPAEYANQEFVGMTRPDSALVKVRPATVQPAADEELYGVKAVPGNMPIPLVESTGMHLLCVTPDPMCADTLRNVEIVTGVDGDLVKWKDRDEYEESLVHQTFHCQPQPITWNLRIMIRIKGAQYLHSVQATASFLSLKSEILWVSPRIKPSGQTLQKHLRLKKPLTSTITMTKPPSPRLSLKPASAGDSAIAGQKSQKLPPTKPMPRKMISITHLTNLRIL